MGLISDNLEQTKEHHAGLESVKLFNNRKSRLTLGENLVMTI